MKITHRNEHGQLILPILAVLVLFGMFWAAYVHWMRELYWKMRMGAAADLVALSSSRQQAAMLNYIATLQMLQNTLLPQVHGYGAMDVSMLPQFETYNRALRMLEKGFSAQALTTAQIVARANGSNRPVAPSWGTTYQDNTSSRLEGQEIKVLLLAGGYPVGTRIFPKGYFARTWSVRKLKAQPDHEARWSVCRNSICGDGRARLWLDIDPASLLNNGGFPPKNASLVRRIGFQCFYPQFNARLLPKAS